MTNKRGWIDCGLIVLAIVLLCSTVVLQGCGGGGPPAGASASERAEFYREKAEREADARDRAEAAKIKAEAAKLEAEKREAAAAIEKQKLNNELKLGREAAKARLVTGATWIGRLGYVTAFASIAGLLIGSFFGGIGRKTALLGLGIAAGCLWSEYFITAHGFFVSEALSWIVLVGLGVAALFAGFLGIRYVLSTWTAHDIASKRAVNLDSAKDAIFALPVSRSIKKSLDDAWEYMRDATPGDSLSEQQARQLLERYGLPVPTPPVP